MNKTPLRIAIRYLFAPKSHSAVNVISSVSVGGVALAVAAMIVVLSVFNGFHSLILSRLSLLDPPLRVERADGRPFAADSLCRALTAVAGVNTATPVIQQRALAMADGLHAPVTVKGVETAVYDGIADINATVIDGETWLDYHPSATSATISIGTANALRMAAGTDRLMTVYAPVRYGRINPANPLSAIRADSMTVSAVFAVDQPEYDTDMIYIPLANARKLFQYKPDEATAIEVSPAGAIDAVKAVTGTGFEVKDPMAQHASSLRIVNIEKWTSFLLLGLIMVIASFNVLSTLALLIVEKSDNALTLLALGAGRGFIRRIYFYQGLAVSIIGGALGMILGVVLCLGQQHFGWVKLSADPSTLTLTAYPVLLNPLDLLPVGLAVLTVGFITALISSRKAA